MTSTAVDSDSATKTAAAAATSEEKTETEIETETDADTSDTSQLQSRNESRIVSSTSTKEYTATGSVFVRDNIASATSTTSTSASSRIIKANSVTSPFAKFRQLEKQNSLPSSATAASVNANANASASDDTRIKFKIADSNLTRSASSIKDRLLDWVKAQTKDYKNVQIDNFSSSWNNGLAFCALIHHFYPHAFDYDKLTSQQRRYNFELAFKVAEQEAGIVPLLDVDDMVAMKRPDWKCVFTYVQTIYQRFHASPEANKP